MHTLKFLSCFCAMLLMAAFNLFAADALVDDCNGTTNQNKFGQYWYMYDDHLDGGSSTIPGVTKTNGTTGDYIVKPTAGAGNTGGAIVLPYSLGPTPCTAGPFNYIGLGTMLCDSNKASTLDLTNAQNVTFYIKAAAATGVDFGVLTKETNAEAGANYHKVIQVTTAWQLVSVPLSSTGIGALSQPTWTKNPVPFNIKSVQKLQWQMHTDNVGTNKTGTIYVDDIYITNYTFVPFDLLPAASIGAPGQAPSSAALLSNMDVLPYNRNARGYYWYCYNDGAATRSPAVASLSDFSAITGGATIPPDIMTAPTILIGPNTANPALDWVHGYSNTNGADIQFTLGPAFNKVAGDGVTIKPFVGVGTALWNEHTSSDIYNGQADGVNGVYFDYMLKSSSSSSVLRLEVYANLFSQDGVVHYIDLPVTGDGVWKGATVKFNQLVLPHWNGVITTTALDPTILKKLQWAVQDEAQTTGELAIDNVYLLGASHITVGGNPIRYQYNAVKAAGGISASMVNNNLKISFPQEMSNASVSLVNTQGSVIVKNLTGFNKSAQLNVSGIAKGVYMLNVKATTKSGAFNKTMPVTIY
jgi:hypothetical protein